MVQARSRNGPEQTPPRPRQRVSTVSDQPLRVAACLSAGPTTGSPVRPLAHPRAACAGAAAGERRAPPRRACGGRKVAVGRGRLASRLRPRTGELLATADLPGWPPRGRGAPGVFGPRRMTGPPARERGRGCAGPGDPATARPAHVGCRRGGRRRAPRRHPGRGTSRSRAGAASRPVGCRYRRSVSMSITNRYLTSPFFTRS